MDGTSTTQVITVQLNERPKILGGVSQQVLDNIKFIGAQITVTPPPHERPDDNSLAIKNDRGIGQFADSSWGIHPDDNAYRVTVNDLIAGCVKINGDSMWWSTFKGGVSRMMLVAYYIPKSACKLI